MGLLLLPGGQLVDVPVGHLELDPAQGNLIIMLTQLLGHRPGLPVRQDLDLVTHLDVVAFLFLLQDLVFGQVGSCLASWLNSPLAPSAGWS